MAVADSRDDLCHFYDHFVPREGWNLGVQRRHHRGKRLARNCVVEVLVRLFHGLRHESQIFAPRLRVFRRYRLTDRRFGIQPQHDQNGSYQPFHAGLLEAAFHMQSRIIGHHL